MTSKPLSIKMDVEEHIPKASFRLLWAVFVAWVLRRPLIIRSKDTEVVFNGINK